MQPPLDFLIFAMSFWNFTSQLLFSLGTEYAFSRHPPSNPYSPRFEPKGVVVQEVEVDEKVEPGLGRERVVKEGGDGAPKLEPVKEVLPGEDQPLWVQQAEAAEQREQDRQAEPVPREDREGLEPVLKVSVR